MNSLALKADPLFAIIQLLHCHLDNVVVIQLSLRGRSVSSLQHLRELLMLCLCCVQAIVETLKCLLVLKRGPPESCLKLLDFAHFRSNVRILVQLLHSSKAI